MNSARFWWCSVRCSCSNGSTTLVPGGCGHSVFWRCSPPRCSCSHCSLQFRCSLCVLAVRPELVAQRLRVLCCTSCFLAVVSCAWVIACIGEVGQVNWIANESIANRLLTEVRGPVVGQFYDFVLFVIVVVAVTSSPLSGMAADAILSSNGSVADRDILALTIGWAVIPTLVLSIVSFVHPIFSVRYVAASAPGAALLAAFICVRAFPKTFDPARDSDRMASSRSAEPNDGDHWHRSSRPPRLSVMSVPPQLSRRTCRVRHSTQPNIGERGCHRSAGPCYYFGRWLLPGERRHHSPLATAWGSASDMSKDLTSRCIPLVVCPAECGSWTTAAYPASPASKQFWKITAIRLRITSSSTAQHSLSTTQRLPSPRCSSPRTVRLSAARALSWTRPAVCYSPNHEGAVRAQRGTVLEEDHRYDHFQ